MSLLILSRELRRGCPPSSRLGSNALSYKRRFGLTSHLRRPGLMHPHVTTPFMSEASRLDVLVVGAGPTGLALASQLARWGVRFRIIDKRPDRAQESRALAVQPRSLELLQSIGLGERLAARGQTTTRLVLHLDRARPATIDLGDIDRTDTRFPGVHSLVSQADTEAVLADYLESCGVTIERRVELVAFQQNSNGLTCALRHADGRDEAIRVSDCRMRRSAQHRSQGHGYSLRRRRTPAEFALGDVEADGPLVPGGVNVFALGRGLAVFFHSVTRQHGG